MALERSEGRPEPHGCWDELYEVLRKPVLVDRHISRELKALWQKLVMQLLTTEQSRTDVYPNASDLIFVVPKLVVLASPGDRIQDCFQKASQGEWKGLIERVLDMPVPKYEQDEGLWPRVLTAFVRGQLEDSTKPRPRDSWARLGNSSELHRQSSLVQTSGMRHWPNSHHTKSREDPSPRGHHPRRMVSHSPGVCPCHLQVEEK